MQIEYLTLSEINALLHNIDNVRDQAIITLIINTGIFLNELPLLTTESVNWDEKILTIPGNRAGKIPLNDQVFQALANWSKERPTVRSTALFITTKGKVKELSPRGVDKLIRKYAKKAGISKRVNAQVLRNTFAVRLLAKEISLAKATEILGINDPQSIKKYSQAAKEAPATVELKTKQDPAEVVEHVDTRPKFWQMIGKLFPTKPHPAKKMSELKGPIVPSPEEVIFGRSGAIEEIKSAVSHNQSLLLIGPIGIGKTHLLRHAQKIIGPNTIYIPSPAPIKIVLNQVCERLNPDWQKQIKPRATTREIAEYISNTSQTSDIEHRTILLIDNLHNLRVSDIDIFLVLLENFTIISAADELKPKLKQAWWKFKQLELSNLTDNAAKELIKYLTQNLSISDYELLETRILTFSNKLPLAIVDMVHQVSHRPIVTRDSVREIYHEAGVRYRDWTMAIVILWGIAIMFRFVALGTHSFEGYILAGFGMAVLGVIRFFMFKMR